MLEASFALFNVDELVTLEPDCHPSARGELGVLSHAALAARDSKIVWVGPMDEFRDSVRLKPDATILNTHGRTVLPGFVDPHTHPVFAGDRSSDFYARLKGISYSEQIQEGGIMTTVRATRAAPEDMLLGLAYGRAETFLRYGTTTIAGKTGYGLTREDELKSLRVLSRLQRLQPLKIVPQFLGAHVLPSDFDGDADAYIDGLVQDWLPSAVGWADSVDVWCDEDAFTEDQCRRVLRTARTLGFALTAHANELGPGNGIKLASELGARSVDHVVYLDDTDVDAMREHGTVAVLLPGTTFFLGSDHFAPARRLIDSGVEVALGTDFNPGTSYTQNMQFIVSLAVVKLGMSPEEAIRSATLNAARAIGLETAVGSLKPGKYCDLSVFCVSDYRSIPYSYAMNLVETVMANGKVVVEEGKVRSEPLTPVTIS